MKKMFVKLAAVSLTFTLFACSSHWFGQSNSPSSQRQAALQVQKNKTTLNGSRESLGMPSSMPATGTPIGGALTSAMDSVDRTKMSRALDKPVGNTSSWTNANSGISYSVSPTRKVTINNNPYCRQYNATAKSGNNERHFTGTACVGADSNWQAVKD